MWNKKLGQVGNLERKKQSKKCGRGRSVASVQWLGIGSHKYIGQIGRVCINQFGCISQFGIGRSRFRKKETVHSLGRGRVTVKKGWEWNGRDGMDCISRVGLSS